MLLGKHLNKYYLKYAFFFILGIVALIVIDYFQTLLPEYLGDLVGLFQKYTSITQIPYKEMEQMIISILILGVIMCLGRMGWRFSIFYASKRIDGHLRHDMFKKAEQLPISFYHDNKIGAIMAWFTNDLETIEEYLGWGTIMLVDAFFLSIIVIIKMFFVDPALAIIALIPLSLIVVWGALVEKFMAIKWTQKLEAYDRVSDFAQETFTGIRVIKAFVKETKELHEFAKVVKKDKDTNISFVRLSILFDVSISIIISTIIATILGLGGYMVYASVTGNPMNLFGFKIILGADEVVTFLGFVELLIWPMMALGQIYSMRSRAKSSLKRISNFLDIDVEVKNCANPLYLENVVGKITFKNFDFKYSETSKVSLKNIDLTIEPGQIIGVVGKIGCGKSTLVNALLRLYNVNEGTLFIDDNDIMKCDIQSVRNAIAYVPQDNFLFSTTITNNISFSSDEFDMDRVIDAAEFAQVHDNIVDFVNGYDTVSGERGVTLSGGQKQRISIARAYYKNSPIMIMDDSVSAVDTKTEEAILNNILNLRKGKTTIIVTSRVSTVKNADKIIVLKDGIIEGFDNHANLIKTSPTYSRMVYLQELEKEVEGGDFNG